MTRPLLEVERLHKSFGGLVAARDLSFSVGRGEILGLIGPNGSGKTTVLNLISGALRASSGEIRLEGERISGLPPFRICRRRIGRTFQLVRVLPGMTAIENVMVGAMFGPLRSAHRTAHFEATELLERVELVVKERDRVRHELLGQGWTVPPTEANFVWLPLGDRAAGFAEHCDAAGVSVRPYLPDGVRVTVADPEANDAFLDAAASYPNRA